MSEIIELTAEELAELEYLRAEELAELENLRAKCLKKDGDFRKNAARKDIDRLCELETRLSESSGDGNTEEQPPPQKKPAKPAGPSFRIDGADPYGSGVLRCLNKLRADQGAEPECLPLVLVPDDPNALVVLANYRHRCRGAGVADAVRLAAVETAIKAFGGKL